MKSRDELRIGCATLLRELRESMGLSKSKMAEKLFIDQHTYAKYETGQSVPSVTDFMYIFSACGKNALRPVLEFIYPELFHGSNDEAARNAITTYINDVASDKELSIIAYVLFGSHGSNLHAQLAEICMLDHLPMEYRYAVGQMVYTLYEMAEKRNELVCTDCVMPNVNVFLDGLTKGKDAAAEGRESYTVLPHK